MGNTWFFTHAKIVHSIYVRISTDSLFAALDTELLRNLDRDVTLDDYRKHILAIINICYPKFAASVEFVVGDSPTHVAIRGIDIIGVQETVLEIVEGEFRDGALSACLAYKSVYISI